MVNKITSPVPPLSLPAKINEIIDAKQDVLVSGTNIKTVNNTSLLGSGNITVTATISGLTINRALVSNASGGVGVSTVTNTELGYVSGVTSAIQTQLNGKQATITGGATTIASSNLTTSRVLISNSSGKVAVSSITSTKLGYLTDVTSNIQAQLDGKMSGSWCTTKATTTNPASSSNPCVIVETYKNGNDWYRKWSDGWIEQGGTVAGDQLVNPFNVVFKKAFSTTDYFICKNLAYNNTSPSSGMDQNFYSRTTTYAVTRKYKNIDFWWYACGY